MWHVTDHILNKSLIYFRSTLTEATYFSTPIVLGPNGVSKNLGMGKISPYEAKLVEASIPELQNSIKKGEAFVNSK